MDRRLFPGGQFVFLAASCLLADCPPALAVDQGTAAIQQALQAEAAGNDQARYELLQKAADLARTEALFRWYRGETKIGDDWLSYDQITAAAEKSNALEQYLRLRQTSSDTLQSQSSLAMACKRLGLHEQEKAHWHAALKHNPDLLVARQRLGFVKSNGKWLPEEQAAEEAKLKARIAELLKSEKADLQRMSRQLGENKLPISTATNMLLQKSDIARIPIWEQYLSAANDSAALAVVDALSHMSPPEASQSLVRHALSHPSGTVRNAARKALNGRDETSYIPLLIGSLRGTWEGKQESVYDPRLKRYVVRYTAVSEQQDAQEAKTLDDVFQLGGVLRQAETLANSIATSRAIRFEAERMNENTQIALKNHRISEILTELTGQTDLVSPQDWWSWWEKHSESIAVGNKPIQTSYAYLTSTVTVEPPPPVLTASSSSPTPSRRPRLECLAAGTLVLTNRGPFPVEKIQTGDLVVARHPTTGETTLKAVIQPTNRAPEKLLDIQLGEDHIRASGGHPFWVSGKGWVRARELQPGMSLHGLTNPVRITAITVEEEPQPSFNLIVADFHSYFVQTGNQRIFSHDNSPQAPIRTTVPGLVQSRISAALTARE